MRFVLGVFFCFFTLAMLSPATSWAQGFCVKHNGVDLKKLPSPGAPTSWRVGKFMPLQGTGRTQKGFVQVRDLDGEEYWVERREVRVSSKCIVIKARQSILRQGPGLDFPQALIASFDRYSPFRDLGGQDGWVQVEDDTGAKGWLNLDQGWKPIQGRLRMSFDRN